MKYSKNSKLNSQAELFIERYKSLDISALSLDPYNQKYLISYQDKIEYNTYLACELISDITNINDYEFVFDIGGGIGFNAAFFSFIGFKNVVYIDIDSVSTSDAKKINCSLGFQNITYKTENYSFLAAQDLTRSLICSRDVIEHIYNLEDFLSVTSRALANRHNTAAVANSMFRKSEFNAIHFNAENIGNKNQILKSRDSSLSYRMLREEIIQEIDSAIPETKLNSLVDKTRGLSHDDIIVFLNEGVYPKNHLNTLGTNTCDPRTGNWAERTLSFKSYRLIASSLGVSLSFNLALYNTKNQNTLKSFVLKVLNLVLQKTQYEKLCPSFTIKY